MTPVVLAAAICPSHRRPNIAATPIRRPPTARPVETFGHASSIVNGGATGQQEAPQGQSEDGDVDGRERFIATANAKIA